MEIPQEVLDLATPKQKQAAEWVNQHKTYTEASKQTGVAISTIKNRVNGLLTKAAKNSVDINGTKIYSPKGQNLKWSTIHYNGSGEIQNAWLRRSREEIKLDEYIETILPEISGPLSGTSKFIKPPKVYEEDLLNVYPIGDAHLGLQCWDGDAEENHDLKRGRESLFFAMRQLVRDSPKAGTALIANLGDFFHADTPENRTSRSGHALDIDTRWHNIIRVGRDLAVELIYLALKKHDQVHVINEIGNHDDQSSYALSLMLESHFNNNPRVHIDVSPKPFHKFRFGKCLFGVTHGDKMKDPNTIYRTMAEDWKDDWGQTDFRYWLMGHIHNSKIVELGSMLFESFRTIIPKDAWHMGMGYRSGREIHRITYHKDFGLWNRDTISQAYLKHLFELQGELNVQAAKQ